MKILLLLLSLCAACALYLISIKPRIYGRPDYTPFFGHMYAHRGLHGARKNGEPLLPENSYTAIKHAADLGYGIEFDYAFRDFHDRFIKTDTGWNISLGSGLDIYEKAENYTLAAARQDRRKCREFSVIYTKE